MGWAEGAAVGYDGGGGWGVKGSDLRQGKGLLALNFRIINWIKQVLDLIGFNEREGKRERGGEKHYASGAKQVSKRLTDMRLVNVVRVVNDTKGAHLVRSAAAGQKQ